MEITSAEIEKFAMSILSEFQDIYHEIWMKNPKWTKIHSFKTLFEIGEKRYSPNNEVQDMEFLQLFTGFLTKTNMEYSSFLAYGAGCLKGKYGAKIFRPDFLEYMKPLAKIGKEYFRF